MKHRVLDFLVCPECISGFSLKIFSIEKQNHSVESRTFGRHHCSFYDKKPADIDCTECFRTEVTDGILTCKKCGRQFPVINGIPRILPDPFMKDVIRKHQNFFSIHKSRIKKIGPKENTTSEDAFKRRSASSFGFQWTTFPGIIEEFRDNFLRYIEPINAEFFNGKLVLDAGCGPGTTWTSWVPSRTPRTTRWSR